MRFQLRHSFQACLIMFEFEPRAVTEFIRLLRKAGIQELQRIRKYEAVSTHLCTQSHKAERISLQLLKVQQIDMILDLQGTNKTQKKTVQGKRNGSCSDDASKKRSKYQRKNHSSCQEIVRSFLKTWRICKFHLRYKHGSYNAVRDEHRKPL